jgi:hypothetical protein
MLSPFVMDSARRVQHLRVPGERFEKRVNLHSDEVPRSAGARGAGGQLHTGCPVPRWGWLKHVHVSVEWLE